VASEDIARRHTRPRLKCRSGDPPAGCRSLAVPDHSGGIAPTRRGADLLGSSRVPPSCLRSRRKRSTSWARPNVFYFRSRHMAKTRSHRAAAALGVVRITAVSGGDALGSLEQRRGVAAREATAWPSLCSYRRIIPALRGFTRVVTPSSWGRAIGGSAPLGG
jgi:hypothetical protein